MASERIKPVVINDDEHHCEYTLEFNRDVVRQAEKDGFNIMAVDTQPLAFYDLWYYAFRMHHKRVARSETNRLLEEIAEANNGIPDGLVARIIELYTAPITFLYGDGEKKDDEDGEPKNASVTVEF